MNFDNDCAVNMRLPCKHRNAAGVSIHCHKRDVGAARLRCAEMVILTSRWQRKVARRSAVNNGYATHSALIIYHTSVSEFSIRRPVSVSRYAYFKDKLHEERLDSVAGLEEEDREYEQLGSYFVYRKYRNIHRFFESYKYHRSEKKYDAMVQIDVSKCFDSIYIHSLLWAVLGKEQTKFSLDASKGAFGGVSTPLCRT